MLSIISVSVSYWASCLKGNLLSLYKMRLLVGICFIISFTEILVLVNGAHTGDITRATRSQYDDIDELIEKVNFDDVVKIDGTSEYAFYQRKVGKSIRYRLDNENQAPPYAKFRIQADNITYARILVEIGHHFGKQAIKDALTQSVRSGESVTLDKPKTR